MPKPIDIELYETIFKPTKKLKQQYKLKQKMNLPKFGGMIVRADPFNTEKSGYNIENTFL